MRNGHTQSLSADQKTQATLHAAKTSRQPVATKSAISTLALQATRLFI